MSPDDTQFGSPSNRSFDGSKQSRSFGASSFGSIRSPPQSSSPFGTASPTYRNSALLLNRYILALLKVFKLHHRGATEVSGIAPIRQPKGPDGTIGFSEQYRKSRGKE